MKRSFGGAAVVLVLLGIPSCKFVDRIISGDRGPADVSDLIESVERVEGEIDESKQSMLSAVQALQKVTAPDFEGDAVKAHEELVDAIDGSDDQANDLRRSVEKMQAAAEPVFDQWTKDLEAYSNPEMRQRSQARLAAARERYDALVATVEPVLVEYETINANLHDHVLFLSHDLNAEAIATIQEDVKKVSKEASDLDGSFNSAKAAARSYVDASAQPKEKAVAVKGS